MQIGVDNMPQFKMGKAKEALMDLIKLELGHSIKCKMNGNNREIPSSIAFSNYPQDKMNVFFNDAVEVVAGMIGTTPKELLRQAGVNA